MVTSKEPDTRMAQFFVSTWPDAGMAQSSFLVPKSQTQEWPRVHCGSKKPDTRMTQVHFGFKEPDTRMAQGSFWFQRARHKNGFVSNGPDTGMTQVHIGSKEPDAGMAHVHIYK